MTVSSNSTLTLVRDSSSEMAWLFLERDCVFMGNEWDFHPGCYGSVVAGIDLVDWDGNRPAELVAALTVALEANDVSVTSTVTYFDDMEEAEDFMVENFDYDRSFS